MRQDLEELLRSVISAGRPETVAHARDVLRRMNGEWTWGCVLYGVAPFPTVRDAQP